MKLITAILVAMSVFCGTVSAQEGAGAYFKWGGIEFTYPLANASAIALYDLARGNGLMGAETRLVSWKRLNLNGGAVTSFQANGMPFASLDFDWAGIIANVSETKLAKVGIWYGHDFATNDNHYGIKASVSMW